VTVERARASLESRFFDVQGLRMHARVSTNLAPAAGPLVVLVHGIGVSSRYMVPIAERLAPECRVYAVDLPGFGKSDKPVRVLPLPELADALAAWMRAANLDRATLLGNSFGCQVVADFAVRYPGRVAQVVLQGPTVDPQGRTVFEQLRRWRRNGRHEPRSLTWVVLRDYWDCGIRRLLKTFWHGIQDRIEEKLPQVVAPTLVVRGTRDEIVPQCWAEEATRLLPRGRLVVVPGVPHTMNYSAPLELVRVIRPFLAEYWNPADGLRPEKGERTHAAISHSVPGRL
jgi:2-hydroxy-6-oxonona-2,4-dienedioate hydrolase